MCSPLPLTFYYRWDTLWALDGKALPTSPVLVTFDDGYRNNLEVAAPELRRFGVPAMLAVTTGHIGSETLLWPQEIDERVLQWTGRTIPLPRGGTAVVGGPLASRAALAERIRRTCKTLREVEVRRYVESLRGEDLQLADWQRCLYDLMTWDEVRALQEQGWSVCSHTVSHPVLSRVDQPRLEHELQDSRAHLRSELGVECPVIVYPDGGRNDVTPAVISAAVDAGYKLGFTLAGRGSNPYPPREGAMLLDRICVSRELQANTFHFWVSGLGDLVQSRPDATELHYR